ncbi:GNAT family N-acetyltransferase [Aestuariivirga sp.]|uniref:GNAT family N-acetyltransferase n=1 Tax=Aestuariivirga sp. TaxID=2650926 RepID=UPI00359397C6
MTSHVLDRPPLNAMLTRHSHLAVGGPRALRYRPDISPFAGMADDSDEALCDLTALIPESGVILVAQPEKQKVPPGAAAEHVVEVVQMVAETVSAPDEHVNFLELSDADAGEMLALATLTKPGPFAARTHDFGGYVGIRAEGKLVAMAGHRFQVPGFTEVSAVCTDPGFRGKGYAGFLTRLVAGRIMARGETPFLHNYATNTNAIRLCETLGFVYRTSLWVSVLRRA